MKKTIAFLTAFVLLISLLFVACGNGGNNQTTDDGPSKASDNHGGEYVYDIDGIEIPIHVDINKYIKGNVFYVEKLADDLGWKPLRPDTFLIFQNAYYYNSESVEVCFSYEEGEMYKSVDFSYNWVGGGRAGGHINFERLDENEECYLVHENGNRNVNKEEIVVFVYIMEKLMEDPNDSPERDIIDLYGGGVWTIN